MTEWLVMLAGALLVGIAKTSVGGLAVLSVLAFAMVMPAKESTGAVLLILLVGDLVAIARYRKDCDWTMLRELVPWVLPGLALGSWFISVVDGAALKKWIGVMIAASLLVHLLMGVRRKSPPYRPLPKPGYLAATGAAGLAAGFTTMAANAGGPVMTLYLLVKRVDKRVFVGTAAWYFLLINLAKVPFSVGVGAITPQVLRYATLLTPVVLIGAVIGIWLLRRIPQRAFNFLSLAVAVLAAGVLILT